MYAGEHAAGTEFMIGPLFLTAGVSAFDLLVGGPILAISHRRNCCKKSAYIILSTRKNLW